MTRRQNADNNGRWEEWAEVDLSHIDPVALPIKLMEDLQLIADERHEDTDDVGYGEWDKEIPMQVRLTGYVTVEGYRPYTDEELVQRAAAKARAAKAAKTRSAKALNADRAKLEKLAQKLGVKVIE